MTHLFRNDENVFEHDSNEICELCNIIADAVIIAIRNGIDENDVVDELKLLCVEFGIDSYRVCHGGLDLHSVREKVNNKVLNH